MIALLMFRGGGGGAGPAPAPLLSILPPNLLPGWMPDTDPVAPPQEILRRFAPPEPVVISPFLTARASAQDGPDMLLGPTFATDIRLEPQRGLSPEDERILLALLATML